MLNIKEAIKRNPGSDSFVKAIFGGCITIISFEKIHDNRYALLYSKKGINWKNKKYENTTTLHFNKNEMEIFDFFLKRKNIKNYTDIKQEKFFFNISDTYLTEKEYENYDN